MKLLRPILFIAALLVTPSGLTETLYKVSVDLEHADTLIDSPSIEVREGKPGLVEVYANNEGYQLVVTVTGEQQNEVTVAANFASAYGNMDPVLQMREREPATVMLDKLKMRFVVERL